MSDSIRMLSETSKTLNSNVIALTRCLILAYLSFSVDGVLYRELKAVLEISDGKLASNLKQLTSMNFVTKEEITLDNKKLDLYRLTPDGKNELIKIKKWMELISDILRG